VQLKKKQPDWRMRSFLAPLIANASNSAERHEISISVSTSCYRDRTRSIYLAHNIPAFDIDAQNISTKKQPFATLHKSH
jgi:hypothetical protein